MHLRADKKKYVLELGAKALRCSQSIYKIDNNYLFSTIWVIQMSLAHLPNSNFLNIKLIRVLLLHCSLLIQRFVTDFNSLATTVQEL